MARTENEVISKLELDGNSVNNSVIARRLLEELLRLEEEIEQKVKEAVQAAKDEVVNEVAALKQELAEAKAKLQASQPSQP